MKSVLVRKLFPLAAVPFILSACSDPTGPQKAPDGLEIRPTANVFPITVVEGRRRVTMTAVVENDSDRTVFYSYCSETVEKRQGNEWKDVFHPVCASIAVPPEPIAPGESKEVVLHFIEHPDIPSIGFPFDDPSAKYRLQVTLLVRRGEKFRLLEGTETGTFAVRN
jgi:hypothetical protein